MQKVLVLLGRASDREITYQGQEILRDFGISYDIRFASTHLALSAAQDMILEFAKQGGKIILCVAASADHLAALASSLCQLPVLSVPLQGSPLLPYASGIPVATMSEGETGFIQAILLALQIFASHDASLYKELQRYRHSQAAQLLQIDLQYRVTFDAKENTFGL